MLLPPTFFCACGRACASVRLVSTACDRLALLKPILGLYGKLYADRLASANNGNMLSKSKKSITNEVLGSGNDGMVLNPNAAAFSLEALMDWIEVPENKARMFPATFLLTREKRGPKKTRLFGNMVAKMEQLQREHIGQRAGQVVEGRTQQMSNVPSGSNHGGVTLLAPHSPATRLSAVFSDDGNEFFENDSSDGGDEALLSAQLAHATLAKSAPLSELSAAKAALAAQRKQCRLCRVDVVQATKVAAEAKAAVARAEAAAAKAQAAVAEAKAADIAADAACAKANATAAAANAGLVELRKRHQRAMATLGISDAVEGGVLSV